MLKMNITGIDDVLNNLQKLSDNAERLNGSHSVPLTELYPDTFIQACSRFASLQELVDASATNMDSPEWAEFIANNTTFQDWQEMQTRSAEEWATRQLFQHL